MAREGVAMMTRVRCSVVTMLLVMIVNCAMRKEVMVVRGFSVGTGNVLLKQQRNVCGALYGKSDSEDKDGKDGKDGKEGEEEEPELVTREMFQRELLADPPAATVRKKKNKSYKVLDNRDALPFVVKVVTPDPYTNREQMKLNARKASEKQQKHKKKNNRDLLVGMGKSVKDGIAASIYEQGNDGSLNKVLGEFQLDKTTNCGDVVTVGEQQFEVQKARCQYKYAGGKRFVMVRKILEVKEVSRAAVELSLQKQLSKSISNTSNSTDSFE